MGIILWYQKKICNGGDLMTSLEIAQKAAEVLDNKKGINISVIDVDQISTLADYFVIATGSSSTHVKALADEVETELKNLKVSLDHIEGHRDKSWILLDYSSVIIHIFSEEARDFYDLERLWKDGKPVDIFSKNK